MVLFFFQKFEKIIISKTLRVQVTYIFESKNLQLNNYSNKLTKQEKENYLNLFVRLNEPDIQPWSNVTKAELIFLGFSLLFFRKVRPPQRVDCLTTMGNKQQVSFQKTQRRIEPGIGNLRSLTRRSTTELSQPLSVITNCDAVEKFVE